MNLTKYDFRTHPVRVINQDGAPLFCLVDVCMAMGLSKPDNVASQVKEEFSTPLLNRGMVTRPDGSSIEANFLTEPQLYFVMMRGRTELARAFRQWICTEVLPAIRKTGKYETPAAAEAPHLTCTLTEAESMLRRFAQERDVPDIYQALALSSLFERATGLPLVRVSDAASPLFPSEVVKALNEGEAKSTPAQTAPISYGGSIQAKPQLVKEEQDPAMLPTDQLRAAMFEPAISIPGATPEQVKAASILMDNPEQLEKENLLPMQLAGMAEPAITAADFNRILEYLGMQERRNSTTWEPTAAGLDYGARVMVRLYKNRLIYVRLNWTKEILRVINAVLANPAALGLNIRPVSKKK